MFFIVPGSLCSFSSLAVRLWATNPDMAMAHVTYFPQRFAATLIKWPRGFITTALSIRTLRCNQNKRSPCLPDSNSFRVLTRDQISALQAAFLMVRKQNDMVRVRQENINYGAR